MGTRVFCNVMLLQGQTVFSLSRPLKIIRVLCIITLLLCIFKYTTLCCMLCIQYIWFEKTDILKYVPDLGTRTLWIIHNSYAASERVTRGLPNSSQQGNALDKGEKMVPHPQQRDTCIASGQQILRTSAL